MLHETQKEDFDQPADYPLSNREKMSPHFNNHEDLDDNKILIGVLTDED